MSISSPATTLPTALCTREEEADADPVSPEYQSLLCRVIVLSPHI